MNPATRRSERANSHLRSAARLCRILQSGSRRTEASYIAAQAARAVVSSISCRPVLDDVGLSVPMFVQPEKRI